MGLDEPQAFIHQQVGQRALELADLTIDFELGVDRMVAAVAEAEEDVELPSGIATVDFKPICDGSAMN